MPASSSATSSSSSSHASATASSHASVSSSSASASSSDWCDLAARYMAAWNAHDVPGIMAFHTEETSYQRHGSPKVYKGKEAVAEQFSKDFAGLPGLHFEPVALYGSDDHFVAVSILTATKPDGTPVTMELVDVITLRNGQVASKSSYFVASRPPK